ncbi:MAG: hypothetical protein ACJA0F_001805 [Dinoroseobacter sp.]
MPRLTLEIADIFRAHGPAWRQANAGHVSLSQFKVMSAIEACPLPSNACVHERGSGRLAGMWQAAVNVATTTLPTTAAKTATAGRAGSTPLA